MYEQAPVINSITSSTIIADSSGSSGQPDIHWEVYPVRAIAPAPTLVGSVTSGSAGAERIERATINMNGASSSIGAQSGSWVSSLTNNSSNDQTLNFAAGSFSIAPTCTCTAIFANGVNYVCKIHTVSSSSLRIQTFDSASGGASGPAFFATVLCMGPR
jgi:hypothetical protein